jgi:hypothetical protein
MDNIYEIASRRAMTLDSLEQILRTAKKEPDASWLIEQMEKTLADHKRRMSELPGKNPTL